MEKVLSLIGPGDIGFHYYEILGLKPEKFQSELENIAKAIAESGWTIELLPDQGISLEIAKLYKQFGGKRVIGTAPISDKRYGIKHIQEYFNEKIQGKKLFDEIIDTEDWRDQNRLKALRGNAVLYLGISPGTEIEFNYGIYLYRLMKGFKKGVKAQAIQNIRAKDNFTCFVYSPFFSAKKLDNETEIYMEKYKINLKYVKNPRELKNQLIKF